MKNATICQPTEQAHQKKLVGIFCFYGLKAKYSSVTNYDQPQKNNNISLKSTLK
jgi:hypothetical protein